MKKKSFLAILCSAALFLQLAPAVLADDVLSDATTDEIVRACVHSKKVV